MFSESETFLVSGSKNFVKEFFTSELPVGDYVVGMEVTYPDGFATSSTHFSVIEEEILLSPSVSRQIMLGAAFVVLTILVILFLIFRYKKAGKHAMPRGGMHA